MQGRAKKRNIRLTLFTFMLTALMLWLILSNFVLVVRNVKVHGNNSINTEHIIRIADLPLGEFIGSVDEEAVSMRILKDGRAKLDRIEVSLPNTLNLYITERVPQMIAVYGGNIVVMDDECVVMDIVESVPKEQVLYVSGLNISRATVGSVISVPEEQRNAICAVLNELKNQNAMYYVSELNVANTDAVYMYASNGMRVRIGNTHNLWQKIIWMRSALTDLESRGEKYGTLDVSSGTMADFMPEN